MSVPEGAGGTEPRTITKPAEYAMKEPREIFDPRLVEAVERSLLSYGPLREWSEAALFNLLMDLLGGVGRVVEQERLDERSRIARVVRAVATDKRIEPMQGVADWIEKGCPGRVVEQQPPTEEPSERVSYDTPERTSSRGPIQAPPGPPEPTQGNEWDRATVDAVVAWLLDQRRGRNPCVTVNLEGFRERFKGAAQDTRGRDS